MASTPGAIPFWVTPCSLDSTPDLLQHRGTKYAEMHREAPGTLVHGAFLLLATMGSRAFMVTTRRLVRADVGWLQWQVLVI